MTIRCTIWCGGDRIRSHVSSLLVAFLFITGCGESNTTQDPQQIGLEDIPSLAVDSMQESVAQSLYEARATVESNPDSAESWGELGMRYHAHNLPEPAAIAFTAAQQRDPEEFRWIYFGAIAQELAGAPPDQVVKKFNEALAAGYEYGSLHVRKAQTLGRAGDLDGALLSYARALELVPDMNIAKRGIGQVLLQMNRAEEARVVLERVYEVAPNDRPTIAALAQCLARLNREPQRAQALAARTSTTQSTLALPDPIYMEIDERVLSLQVLKNNALDAMKANKLEKAKALFVQVLKYEPNNASVFLELGFIEFRLGNLPEAEAIWKRAININSELPSAHSGLATIWMASGRWEEANQALDRAIALAPGRWLNHVRNGHCLLRMGDPSGAEEAMRTGLEVARDKGRVYREWGNVLLACGKPGQALETYEVSLELNPRDSVTWYGVGRSLEQLNEMSQAMEAYQQSASIDPNGKAANRLNQLRQR